MHLPTTPKETQQRGWDFLDVILITGDAYVDHPSYGIAIISRILEAEGLRVAILPQPDWHGDLRDFRKLGQPRLFFGVAAGNMDSMVNRYTAARRLRSQDAYSPNGQHSLRPDYATIVYTQTLRKLYPSTPIVIGGIEASMRRLAHYDYWSNSLRGSILVDSGADLLVYGMGEKTILQIAREGIHEKIPQTAYLSEEPAGTPLYSYEECLADKRKQAQNFRTIEENSNIATAETLCQRHGDKYVVVNPPPPLTSTEELDRIYALPYTRLPHPRYKGKRIPAYEMIRHSITLHRGCYGGCAFCTISAHQGKRIVSRSQASIVQEAEQITKMADFKGYISDLGGPSANMYRTGGKDIVKCEKCRRHSCLHPQLCANLNIDLTPLIEVYRAVDALPDVKKSFVSSGVRYDMLTPAYTQELIIKHVSGRLKVAPEHTAPHVLSLMRKPSFALFREFKQTFDNINKQYNLRQELIPYFISAHPACTVRDMQQLSQEVKQLRIQPEQVQMFTPTPMTLATEIYYTGISPYTLKPVYVSRNERERQQQHKCFFPQKQRQ